MADKLTQEELTSVRQLMRVLGALQKIEPIIQKVLVSDEELSKVQREKNALAKEVGAIRAEVEAARKAHREELEAVANEVPELRAKIEREILEAREEGLKRVREEIEAEKKNADTAQRELHDEVAGLQEHLENKRKELHQAEQAANVLSQRKAELEGMVAKLAETSERHKADIAALLNSMQANLPV